jgi:Tannase and feruloyl esterase
MSNDSPIIITRSVRLFAVCALTTSFVCALSCNGLAADRAQDCARLAGIAVPATAIELSTAGATVISAMFVQNGFGINGESCRVLGKIAPDSASAATGTPDINFQLNLPSQWNGKIVQMGGGGYNGMVVTGTNSILFARSTAPLFQGYATLGADSGHVGLTTTGDFGRNDGALRNFGYEYLKKTHDAGYAIMKSHYGRLPDKSYFAGGSVERTNELRHLTDVLRVVISDCPAQRQL